MADPKWNEESDVSFDIEKRVERPRLFRVLLHNDDYTTMEFVVLVLETVFRRSENEATRIMLAVHKSGVGTAGVYPKEIAETKVARATDLARENEFPLLCTLEPEE